MESPYFNSKTYQKITEASRAGDLVRRASILEQAIATSTGAEKAFWMGLQYEYRWRTKTNPRELRQAWRDLEALLQAAPGHPDTAWRLMWGASALYVWTERYEGPPTLLTMCRPFRHRVLHDHSIRAHLGYLYMKKRRWHSAYRNLTLCLTNFRHSSAARQEAKAVLLHYIFAKRALALVMLQRYEEAEADIAEARAMAAARHPTSYDLTTLALAEAALAYARGEYHTARTALQSANNARDWRKHPPCWDVDLLLMAARIARAEGNSVSFEHFCQRAGAICQEYDLPLSAQTVETVRNGADY